MPDVIGVPLDRIDGPSKVRGAAKYSAEIPAEKLAHAVLVLSTIAQGTVVQVDSAAAERATGVLAVLSSEKPFKLAISPEEKQNPQDKVVHVLQTRRVAYQNQPVALVVADTLERAAHAAALVKIHYREEKGHTDFQAEQARAFAPKPIFGKEPDLRQGTPGTATEVTVKATYSTPHEHHNPMEPHATMALWEGNKLTIYDATQGVFNERKRLAAIFGIPSENVRVICKFVGGGFGCKGSTWSHTILTAMAAHVVQRPVRLVLRRPQMFGPVGYRPRTEQRLELHARRDGSLTHVLHHTVNSTSDFDDFTEPSALTTRMLYASESIDTSHKLVRLTLGTPTFMRAPGEASGSFALESAMDELAHELKMDPIALRLKNYAEKDPETGHPFSSKALRQCYQVGAERFGWARRTPEPRSMRDGKALIGWGMATATYPVHRSKASARAQLLPDGTATVVSGSQDLGTGTYTIMTQIAAETLGLAPSQVHFDLGDTQMPATPVSGGSMTAASVGSAVKMAAQGLRDKAIALAIADPASPLHGADSKSVRVQDGRMVAGAKQESYRELLKRHPTPALEATAETQAGEEAKAFSMHSFGAQFAEVKVDPELGEVRVTRWVGSYGVGKVLNAKTCRSQLIGGVVFGIGMALMEESVVDGRSGRFITQDLADYHVPVQPDIPEIDVSFVPEVDFHINEVGAKGVGELGITGAAAAIANAVFHATGKRVRELPITLDKLL